MQFLKNVILIFLDRSKCRAHSDMLSSIPLKFKMMQDKMFIHIRPYMCYTLQFSDTFQELKTICPFRFRYVFKTSRGLFWVYLSQIISNRLKRNRKIFWTHF